MPTMPNVAIKEMAMPGEYVLEVPASVYVSGITDHGGPETRKKYGQHNTKKDKDGTHNVSVGHADLIDNAVGEEAGGGHENHESEVAGRENFFPDNLLKIN